MSAEGAEIQAKVLGAALAEARRLADEAVFTPADEAHLDARFELATVQALRVPALAERSATLRRIAKRVVPPVARPPLRKVATAGDRFARKGFEAVEARRRSR